MSTEKEQVSIIAKIFLKSKKARALIVGLLLVVLNDKIGLDIQAEQLEYAVYLVCAYLTGQGIADHGKEKAMIEASNGSEG